MAKAKEKSIKDLVLSEYENGNIVHNSITGPLTIKLEDFLDQPVDGILYDLNKPEEVTLSGIDENDTKWINDYAVAKLIRILFERNKKMFDMLKEIYIYQDTWSADEVCALLEDIKGKPIKEIINE